MHPLYRHQSRLLYTTQQRQSCGASGCKLGSTRVYVRATGLGEKTESVQVSTLLAVIGAPARLHSSGTLQQMRARSTRCWINSRHSVGRDEMFYKQQQQAGETFDQYVTELRQLAISCNIVTTLRLK